MSGKLFVVGTPIGNLGDFSPRAVETFEKVDFIAAEDTRVTVKLLNHFGIKKPLVSYHEHNRYEQSDYIIVRLEQGETCALVTDAGMPAISDPGVVLVDKCYKAGIAVESVPGPTALTTALAISGMDIRRFTFEGFLTQNKTNRRTHLEEIKSEKRTMVFYEAPHKLPKMLADVYAALGDRRIAIIKELTKIYESIERTTLAEAVEKYKDAKLKGEFVIIIEAAEETESEKTLEDAVDEARDLMDNEEVSANEASKRIAKITGFKKGDIYRELQN